MCLLSSSNTLLWVWDHVAVMGVNCSDLLSGESLTWGLKWVDSVWSTVVFTLRAWSPWAALASDWAQQGHYSQAIPAQCGTPLASDLCSLTYGLRFSQSCPTVWDASYSVSLSFLSLFTGVRPASRSEPLSSYFCYFSPLSFTGVSSSILACAS